MKNISRYITEKLRLDDPANYNYFPKTRNELMDIIENKIYGENGKKNNKIIDVSDIYISDLNPKSIGIIFSYYEEIEEIKGLEHWDVSNIKKMHELFGNCKNLKSIKGIENWDVSNCNRFDGMFLNCESLENLDLSKWRIDKDANIVGMFDGCNVNSIGNINYKLY